jgi:hypothetical protein
VTTIIATSIARIATTMIAQRRSAAKAIASERWTACPARQVGEEVEREPDRDDDRGGDTGDRERARRAALDDRVDPALLVLRAPCMGAVRVVGVVGHLVPHSGSSLRSSLA